jgi:hypothetical protein
MGSGLSKKQEASTERVGGMRSVPSVDECQVVRPRDTRCSDQRRAVRGLPGSSPGVALATHQQQEENIMGDIGEPLRHIELEPVEVPLSVPVPEEVPA